jgi:hypothetical protein
MTWSNGGLMSRLDYLPSLKLPDMKEMKVKIRARHANSKNHQNNVENVSYGTTNEEFGNYDDDDGSAGLLFTTSSECVAIGLADEIFD